jgi:hypothetical protein
MELAMEEEGGEFGTYVVANMLSRSSSWGSSIELNHNWEREESISFSEEEDEGVTWVEGTGGEWDAGEAFLKDVSEERCRSVGVEEDDADWDRSGFLLREKVGGIVGDPIRTTLDRLSRGVGR